MGGLSLDLNTVFFAELIFASGAFLGDDLADADGDARFGGLRLSLSFSFDGVSMGGFDLDSIGCFDVELELVFVPCTGDGRADATAVEFEREGGGVGAAGGLAYFVGDNRADVDTSDMLDLDPARLTKAMPVVFEDNDLAPSAVFGLVLCSSLTLRGVRCDETARRKC